MTMKKLRMILQHPLLIVLIVFACGFYKAQTNKCHIVFSPMFGKSSLSLNKYYPIGVSDSLQIASLKFYVSGIELWQDKKQVWKEKTEYHLIDFSELSSLQFILNIDRSINFNSIGFDLGIDSVTNVSGALGGVLDPTKGMYWTWQSGYINLKLEGNSNVCKTRHNEFVFHLGGYQKPFLGVQHIQLETSNKNKTIITIDMKEVMNSIDLVTQNHIMSPSKEAVKLAEVIAIKVKAE